MTGWPSRSRPGALHYRSGLTNQPTETPRAILNLSIFPVAQNEGYVRKPWINPPSSTPHQETFFSLQNYLIQPLASELSELP